LWPNLTVAHPKQSVNKQPDDEAELLENLASSVGSTDQGDGVPAPTTKRRARKHLPAAACTRVSLKCHSTHWAMNRILILAIATILTVPFTRSPAARVMETVEAVIVRNAMVAVVNISTWKVRPPADTSNQARRVKAYASGFIVDADGIIVTNKHVIEGAVDIEVTLSNGDRLPGKILAAAAMLDLALIKIDVDRPLPVLKWGNSDDLQVGDPVLTIGNPLGLGTSVSAGIVSALNRDLEDTPFNSYIHTDRLCHQSRELRRTHD
jgi:S1-C subfamily serine protease